MTATATTGARRVLDDFFSKDIPEPIQILGLKLLPLSIGRYRRMARHGIGFVSESKTSADGKDLILGVLICSMTCRAWDALAVSRLLPRVISSWLKQIHAAPPWYLCGQLGRIVSATWLGKRWRTRHSFDLFEKSTLFKNYVAEAQAVPRHLVKDGARPESSSHWSHNIEVVLRGELGWTREEIEERPLSSAIADYFKHMENQGLITILTEQDFDMLNNNNAAIAKAVAEHEARQHAEAAALAERLAQSAKEGAGHGL